MSREDFLDTPSAARDDELPAAGARRIRRPLNGGWTLMIAAGLIAAVTNYAVLTIDEATVPIAVLGADAPAGTPLEQLDVRMVEVPLEDPRAHQLADAALLDAMRGQVTSVRLPAGVMLRASDLRVPSGEGQGAMSLPIDTTRAVGGLLQPGDRVDVIAGTEDSAGYVVRDLQVIEVTTQSSAIGSTSSGYAITVAVDGDQALRLAQGMRSGEVDVVRTASGGQR